MFFHKEALATNVWNLNFGVIPKHAYEKSLPLDYTLQDHPDHVKYENDPISGGPYKLTKRIRGQEIVLTRRDDYYMVNGKQVRDKPYFKEVRFRVISDTNTALLALKKGDLDELLLTPEVWKTQTTGDDFYERCTKSYGVEWTTFHFQWNLKNPLFADVRTRKALSLAFDYDEMLNKSFYGLYQQSAGMFHPDAGARRSPHRPCTSRTLPPPRNCSKRPGGRTATGTACWTVTRGEAAQIRVQHPLPPDSRADSTLHAAQGMSRQGRDRSEREAAGTDGHAAKAARQGFPGGVRRLGDGHRSGHLGQHLGDRGGAQLRVVFESRGRQVVRSGPQGIRPREAGGNLRQDSHPHVRRQPYTWLYSRNSFYAFNKQLRGYAFSPRGPYHYGPGVGAMYKVKP